MEEKESIFYRVFWSKSCFKCLWRIEWQRSLCGTVEYWV